MTHKTTRKPVEAPMCPWGVVMFESHHAGGFRMKPARHAWLEVFYVLEGSGVFEIAGRPVACRSGDVVVVPIDHEHRIHDDADDPLAMYGLRVEPRIWMDTGLEKLLPSGCVRRNILISGQVRAMFRQLLLEQSLARPTCGAMMVGLAVQALAFVARVPAGAPLADTPEPPPTASRRAAVEDYIADLEHRFLESTKIDNVARELGVSRRTFTDLFREVTGTTWSRYLRRFRIGHARELLGATDKSIVAVAFESGYEDLSTFYRAFHAETGISPQRWRHRERKCS